MVRPSSKAAKKRDPRRAEEWPLEKYPYIVSKPNESYPIYKSSIKEARDYLKKELATFRKQFEFLNDEPILMACDRIAAKINGLTDAHDKLGLTIDEVIDPRTQLRYKVTVMRRAG